MNHYQSASSQKILRRELCALHPRGVGNQQFQTKSNLEGLGLEKEKILEPSEQVVRESPQLNA